MHFLVRFNLRKKPTLTGRIPQAATKATVYQKKTLMFIHHKKWYYSLEKLLPMPEIFISVLSESSMKRRKWKKEG